ncbi:MAG: hypothetical protein U0L91_08410 [Gemmiger sp.]|uniref:hypothetical protein n=1 Tax=Gemmiger sp. TaxID=2049027 RepID=UPI002E784A36|nr:hypothetical protein [Gemmiger sp.]MEE0801283.1 hypothetical protein [Gemmiger sp.]
MMQSIPKFLTIRETAKTGILSEHCLRLMEKRNELPCVYSGNRCLVNFDRLLEQLNHPAGKGGDAE